LIGSDAAVEGTLSSGAFGPARNAARVDALAVFEDDRLPDLAAADLTWLLEEFYRHHPASRDSQTVTFLTEGGFPETLGTGERDRARRLRSYVDVEDPLQPHDHVLILYHNQPNPALPIPGAMVSLSVVASNGPAEEP